MSDAREVLATLTHLIHGQGPRKVIALHGLFDTGDEYSQMTAGFDPKLWQVAIPDIRGFGNSRTLAGPYNLGAIVADALALADELGWSSFSVIGHSMSSKAALRLAVSASTRVDRIVAVAPVWAGPVPLDEAGLAWFRSSAEDVGVRAEIIATATGHRLPTFWSRNLALHSMETSRVEAYAGYVDSFLHEDFVEAVRNIGQPVLVVLGAHDMTTETAVRETWLKHLPDARLEMIADGGHWPMLETPLLLGRLIEDFLHKGEEVI